MTEPYILLIEDNPDDYELIERALKETGLRNPIHIIPNGLDAEHFLTKTGPVLPVVVLLDLGLPGKPGLKVLEAIRAREHTRLLRVVVLTSSPEQEAMIRSYELGANSFIRKPVDGEKFFKAVQQLGAYWALLNERPDA